MRMKIHNIWWIYFDIHEFRALTFYFRHIFWIPMHLKIIYGYTPYISFSHWFNNLVMRFMLPVLDVPASTSTFEFCCFGGNFDRKLCKQHWMKIPFRHCWNPAETIWKFENTYGFRSVSVLKLGSFSDAKS